MTNRTSESPLPTPPGGARWRWASSRRAMVGGGVLAAVLSLGGAAAGASNPKSGSPPSPSSSSSNHRTPPSGQAQPTTGGQVTALAGDTITIERRSTATQTVTYASSTTFRTRSSTVSAADLNVGDFITVEGTKNANDSVTARTIMISTSAPGPAGARPAGPPGGKALAR